MQTVVMASHSVVAARGLGGLSLRTGGKAANNFPSSSSSPASAVAAGRVSVTTRAAAGRGRRVGGTERRRRGNGTASGTHGGKLQLAPTTTTTETRTTTTTTTTTDRQQRQRRGTVASRLSAINGSVDETDPENPDNEAGGDLKEVAAWIGAALLFGLGIGATMGGESAEQYFAGYLLEQSLSVDNLFVFVLVFDYFKVPLKSQQRVLGWGIGGAMAMRAAMIVVGSEAVTNFKPILLVFAGVLIFSSYKLLAEDDEEEEDMSENAIVKFCSGLLPVSEEYDGDRFFTLVDGVKTATPLLLCLCVIELSDVVFAVDSIPAVFGVTQNPFIVYSSNIFAILGLRSLYAFVATIIVLTRGRLGCVCGCVCLSASVAELEYLQTAVAAVLGFVGLKMVADFGGLHVSTEASLAVVVGMLGAGVTLSLVKKDDEGEKAEAKETK